MQCEVRVTIKGDDGKTKAGVVTFVQSNNEEVGEITLNALTSLWDHSWHHIKKNAQMAFINGWALDEAQDDGELTCIYCGNRTEGFNGGRYKKDEEFFDPHKTPCSCRPPQ